MPSVPYRCGTCASTVLILRAVGDGWTVQCLSGHVWVPTPGTELVIESFDPDERES